MARRAQAMTAADPKGPAPAKAGHNGIDEATFFKGVSELEALERAQKTAVANVRNKRKALKEAGFVLKELDAIRTLQKFSQPELAAKFNTMATYAKWLNTPVFSQMPMFDMDAGFPATTEADAYSAGVVSGKRGESMERNPWPLDIPIGREWGRGHKEGNMTLAAGFKQKSDGDATGAKEPMF